MVTVLWLIFNVWTIIFFPLFIAMKLEKSRMNEVKLENSCIYGIERVRNELCK